MNQIIKKDKPKTTSDREMVEALLGKEAAEEMDELLGKSESSKQEPIPEPLGRGAQRDRSHLCQYRHVVLPILLEFFFVLGHLLWGGAVVLLTKNAEQRA